MGQGLFEPLLTFIESILYYLWVFAVFVANERDFHGSSWGDGPTKLIILLSVVKHDFVIRCFSVFGYMALWVILVLGVGLSRFIRYFFVFGQQQIKSQCERKYDKWKSM